MEYLREVSRVFYENFQRTLRRQRNATSLSQAQPDRHPVNDAQPLAIDPEISRIMSGQLAKRGIHTSFDPALNDEYVQFIRTVALADGRFASLIARQVADNDSQYAISIHAADGTWQKTTEVISAGQADIACDHDINLRPDGKIEITHPHPTRRDNSHISIQRYQINPNGSVTAFDSYSNLGGASSGAILYSRIKNVNGQSFVVFTRGDTYDYIVLNADHDQVLDSGTLGPIGANPHVSIATSPTQLAVYFHSNTGSKLQFFNIGSAATAPQLVGTPVSVSTSIATAGLGGVSYFNDLQKFAVIENDSAGALVAYPVNTALTAIESPTTLAAAPAGSVADVTYLGAQTKCAATTNDNGRLTTHIVNPDLSVAPNPIEAQFTPPVRSVAIAVNNADRVLETARENDNTPITGFSQVGLAGSAPSAAPSSTTPTSTVGTPAAMTPSAVTDTTIATPSSSTSTSIAAPSSSISNVTPSAVARTPTTSGTPNARSPVAAPTTSGPVLPLVLIPIILAILTAIVLTAAFFARRALRRRGRSSGAGTGTPLGQQPSPSDAAAGRGVADSHQYGSVEAARVYDGVQTPLGKSTATGSTAAGYESTSAVLGGHGDGTIASTSTYTNPELARAAGSGGGIYEAVDSAMASAKIPQEYGSAPPERVVAADIESGPSDMDNATSDSSPNSSPGGSP